MISEYISTDAEYSSRKESNIGIHDDSLYTTLGGIMKDKQSFWKNIIEEHVLSCYNMVTIHKNYFEDLLANDIPTEDTMIELKTRRTVKDIPIKELLLAIKDTYENSRIVDMVEIDGNDMILYHNYRNQEAVNKLKSIIVTMLENSGHSYDAKSTSNMIILKYKQNTNMWPRQKMEQCQQCSQEKQATQC
jgi:hypothetical protein